MFRRGLFAATLLAICVGAVTWLSGPDGFDYVDGTEFVIAGRELGTPHPPGYPLFIFVLRTSSEILPCSTIDYDAFRMVSSLIAAAGYIAGVAVMMSFGVGITASLLGSLLFFMSGPVLGQLNMVEVHGFAVLLALVAILYRRSRSGPYFFSLAVFGGHPLAILLLPVVFTKRFRERWVLLAAIPASLVLFVPVRSMFPALAHYAYPSSAGEVHTYFTLYTTYVTGLSNRVLDSFAVGMGLLPTGILAGLIALSRKMRWKLLASIAAGMIFLSVYGISDTDSMLWLVLLPLAIWAASGIDSLVGTVKGGLVLMVLLVGVSASLGIKGSWKAGDNSASIISRDRLRGIAPEAVYISLGFDTFCTAYLMEVEDRRPDIIPMDGTECFFRIRPPKDVPSELAGRSVYTNHGWGEEEVVPCGILFSAGEIEVDWDMYDLFWMTTDVIDQNSRMMMADIWLIRGMQTKDSEVQAVVWSVAQNWAGEGNLGIVNQRIAQFLETKEEDTEEDLTAPDLEVIGQSASIEGLPEDSLNCTSDTLP